MAVCKFCQKGFERVRHTGRQERYCPECIAVWPSSGHRTRDIRVLIRAFTLQTCLCRLCDRVFEDYPEANQKLPVYCKECKEDPWYSVHAWNKRNPEKVKAARLDKTWRKTERGLMMRREYQRRRMESKLYCDNRFQMIYVDNMPCKYCGEDNKDRLQCDHRIPRMFGGPDDRWNLQILCVGCHAIKSSEDMLVKSKIHKLGEDFSDFLFRW